MVKQKAFAVTLSEIAEYLKKHHGFPDDTEVCNVVPLPATTRVVVTVHSDEFEPLPFNIYMHELYPLKAEMERPSRIMERWKKDEKEWEVTKCKP